MQQDAEEKFNELMGLAVVLERWGRRVAEHLPQEALEKMADAFNTQSAYTLKDHGAYEKLKNDGPESIGGFDAASEVVLRTLKEGERNVGLIFNHLAAEHHGKYLPPEEYRQGWAERAGRHGLPVLQNLFSGKI